MYLIIIIIINLSINLYINIMTTENTNLCDWLRIAIGAKSKKRTTTKKN